MDHLQVPPSVPATAPGAPLPLRFSAPQGWPTPSVDWLAANQGWDPPVGWTPAPGIASAPAGWAWWSRDEVGWKLATGPVLAAYTRSILVASLVFALGVALTVATLTLHTSFGVIFWGAIVFAPFTIVRQVRGLRRSTSSFLAEIRNRAAVVRQTLDTSTYSSYLATNPADPLPFDRFLARRADEAWSFTNSWPVDQNHAGVTDQFRFPAPVQTTARRVGTIVFAVLAGIALIAIVVSSVGHSNSASGQGSGTTAAGGTRPDGGLSASGPADVDSDPSGDPVRVRFLADSDPTKATCNADNCWVVRISADSSCSQADVVMEFSTSKSGDPTRHETYQVDLRAGKADLAPAALDAKEQYSDIADAWCSVGTSPSTK